MAALMLMTNCSPPKPAPPIFSLYGFKRMAVLPFENKTHDPALAKDLQESVTGSIVRINAVPVMDADQISAWLTKIRIHPSKVTSDPALRKKLADEFQCDILLTGSADLFAEYLKDRPPERIVINDSTGEGKWGFYTDRKTVIHGTAKIFDLATGSLIWTKDTEAYSNYNTWNPLPLPGRLKVPDQLREFIDLAVLVRHRINGGDNEPLSAEGNPSGGLLYTRSGNFGELRRNALGEAVNYLSSDFWPRYGWTPPPKVPSEPPPQK